MARIGKSEQGFHLDTSIIRPANFVRDYREKPKILAEKLDEQGLETLVTSHYNKLLKFFQPNNMRKSVDALMLKNNYKQIFIDYYLYFKTNCSDEIEDLIVAPPDQNTE